MAAYMRSLNLLFLLFLIVLPALRATITFSNVPGNVTYQTDTYDYFEYKQPYFNKTGCVLVQVTSTSSHSGCTFSPARPLPGFNINGALKLNYTCAVLFLDMYYGVLGGCNNLAEMALGVQNNFVPTLANVQYPDKDLTLVVIIPRPANTTGLLGGPVTTRYLSHSFGTSDGAPVLPTMILPYENAKGFSDVFTPLRIGEVLVNIEQQAGPWNDAFLSPGYIAFRWILFAATIILVVYSLYRLFLATVQGTVKLDQRTIVFVGGLISAIMFAVGLCLRRQTQLYTLLDIISSFVFAIAFYLLLILWTGILSKVQKMSQFSPLRIGIYVAMLIAAFNLVYGLVWISIWPNAAITAIHTNMRYILPASQLLVALLFLFYAVRFQMRKGSYNASKDTRRALTKLAWLAVLGFVTFLIKAVTNFLGADPTVSMSVAGMMVVYLAQDIAAFARAAAILLVLGVRLPETRTGTTTSGTQQSSTRTFLSWGGWSKGWRRAIYGSQATSQTMSQSMSQTASTSVGMMSSTGYGDKKNRFSKATARLSSGGSSDTATGVVTPTTGVALHAPTAESAAGAAGPKWRPSSTMSTTMSSGGNKRWRK